MAEIQLKVSPSLAEECFYTAGGVGAAALIARRLLGRGGQWSFVVASLGLQVPIRVIMCEGRSSSKRDLLMRSGAWMAGAIAAVVALRSSSHLRFVREKKLAGAISFPVGVVANAAVLTTQARSAPEQPTPQVDLVELLSSNRTPENIRRLADFRGDWDSVLSMVEGWAGSSARDYLLALTYVPQERVAFDDRFERALAQIDPTDTDSQELCDRLDRLINASEFMSLRRLYDIFHRYSALFTQVTSAMHPREALIAVWTRAYLRFGDRDSEVHRARFLRCFNPAALYIEPQLYGDPPSCSSAGAYNKERKKHGKFTHQLARLFHDFTSRGGTIGLTSEQCSQLLSRINLYGTHYPDLACELGVRFWELQLPEDRTVGRLDEILDALYNFAPTESGLPGGFYWPHWDRRSEQSLGWIVGRVSDEAFRACIGVFARRIKACPSPCAVLLQGVVVRSTANWDLPARDFVAAKLAAHVSVPNLLVSAIGLGSWDDCSSSDDDYSYSSSDNEDGLSDDTALLEYPSSAPRLWPFVRRRVTAILSDAVSSHPLPHLVEWHLADFLTVGKDFRAWQLTERRRYRVLANEQVRRALANKSYSPEIPLQYLSHEQLRILWSQLPSEDPRRVAWNSIADRDQIEFHQSQEQVLKPPTAERPEPHPEADAGGGSASRAGGAAAAADHPQN